jgi:hypothetical protein
MRSDGLAANMSGYLDEISVCAMCVNVTHKKRRVVVFHYSHFISNRVIV